MRLRLAGIMVLAACGHSSPPAAVALRAEPRGRESALVVVPARDLRINARVPPALELESGGIVRLARGRVSPDSSYFLESPWEVRPPGVPIRGRLRVSYCRRVETVCRSVTLPVDVPD
jgi:hypothetical protein